MSLRTWIIGIVIFGFWAAMMTLLVRVNSSNGSTPFSRLPPAFVLRQIFKNEVSSQMGIYEGRKRIGSVTVTPTRMPENTISFDGTLTLPDGDGGKMQGVAFGLELAIKPETPALREVTLRLRRRSPEFTALFQVLLEKQILHYEIKSGGVDLGTQDMPLTPAALSSAVPMLAGLPLPMMQPGKLASALEIQANRASAVIRGERMDVFRLRFGLGDVQATAILGQLGEVFMIQTSTNYSLLADGLDPATHLPK